MNGAAAMSESGDHAVRTPVGVIVLVSLLALLFGSGAIWEFRHLLNGAVVVYHAILALLFGAVAALLAARRRAAVPVYWIAVAVFVFPLAVLQIRRMTGPSYIPTSAFAELIFLGMLGTIGLRISRRRLRHALR